MENCAVGNQEGELYLSLRSGAGAAHIVDTPAPGDIKVRIEKLLAVLRAHNIDHVVVLCYKTRHYRDVFI